MTNTPDQDLIYQMIEVCAACIENTQELVADHDIRLGRTTTKNKRIGQQLDQDIIHAQNCLHKLKAISK